MTEDKLREINRISSELARAAWRLKMANGFKPGTDGTGRPTGYEALHVLVDDENTAEITRLQTVACDAISADVRPKLEAEIDRLRKEFDAL